MQVVVNGSRLSSEGDTQILCSFTDDVSVNMKDFPSGSVLLNVPTSAIRYSGIMQVLAGNWRETNKQELIAQEAERRISDVFPDYSQRNSDHEINDYILSYGADIGKWPAAAQARKAEIDRCWAYIDAVRARAKQSRSVSLKGDPTQDSKWPTKITPYTPR